jgi:hypothetical protein
MLRSKCVSMARERQTLRMQPRRLRLLRTLVLCRHRHRHRHRHRQLSTAVLRRRHLLSAKRDMSRRRLLRRASRIRIRGRIIRNRRASRRATSKNTRA